MPFNIASNIAELAARLKGIPTALDTAIANRMRKATLLVEADAKKNSPVRTGNLRRSITSLVTVLRGRVEGIVGSPVVYAPFVHATNPFLKMTLDADSDQVASILATGMKEGIEGQ